MSADDRTRTHLSRLGINPVVQARLQHWADQDNMTLREMVRYVLSDYAPPPDVGSEPQPIPPDYWETAE